MVLRVLAALRANAAISALFLSENVLCRAALMLRRRGFCSMEGEKEEEEESWAPAAAAAPPCGNTGWAELAAAAAVSSAAPTLGLVAC